MSIGYELEQIGTFSESRLSSTLRTCLSPASNEYIGSQNSVAESSETALTEPRSQQNKSQSFLGNDDGDI